MSRCLHAFVAASVFFLESAAHCGESADNRAGKTWSFEGTSSYRSYDVREYSLGLTRFDDLGSLKGGTSIVLSRMWTNRAYYGNRNRWKLDGHSAASNYRKFLGNSFFVEASLVGEVFRAWADAYSDFFTTHEAEDFGNASRLVMTIQCGNQWQWENLNFGITWLGAIIPLMHKADGGKSNRSFHSYLTTSSNLGIRVSVGWAI